MHMNFLDLVLVSSCRDRQVGAEPGGAAGRDEGEGARDADMAGLEAAPAIYTYM